ncbi:Oxidoreductase AflY [Pyrenophora tritici-repentis]|nr:Oxidoreductase AflY [Pyrenophora tritici-repentis]KAI2475999.1 Oxidoreductase AflY [Pyrenophora tritici-repentis]
MTAKFSHVASNKVQLSPTTTPGFVHTDGLTEESTKKTSDLLTINHEAYHTRWKATFHNHITHHLLALWSLGASPNEIQDMWEYNKTYQAPVEKRHDEAISEHINLKDPADFNRCLGKDDCYVYFLRFFEDEVSEKGVPAVVKEYLLKGDERANDIFSRMYTDLVHPMIHLGCGIEYQQPSIVAEALAGACVHENWPMKFLLPAEDQVRSNPNIPSKSLLEVIDGLRQDPLISAGVKDSDPFNKIPDGFLKRVTAEQLVPHLSQFQVAPTPEDLQRKMGDMMHTSAYMLGAAQRPGKRETMDFVLLHSATLSVFYPAIISQEWLSNHEKARLLEAKARVDAVMYAGCGCPPLYPARIVDYAPLHPEHGWKELFHRAIVYRDEGHAAKLARSLFSLEKLHDVPPNFPIAKKDFFKIAHMAIDSIERAVEVDGNKMPQHVADAIAESIGEGGEMVARNQMRWVFYGGLEKAWDYVPNT